MGGEAAGLPLCHEECVAARQMFCYSEWSKLVSRNIDNVGVGKVQVQSCEKQKVKEDSNNISGGLYFIHVSMSIHKTVFYNFSQHNTCR